MSERVSDAFLDQLRAQLAQAEPDGEVIAGTGSLNDLAVIRWCSDYRPKIGDKIYAAPDRTGTSTGVSIPPQPERDRLAQGWQPIETAPKDGTEILGGFYSTRGEWVRFVMALAANGTWVSVPGSWAYNPTHWMPLPAAPESEGKWVPTKEQIIRAMQFTWDEWVIDTGCIPDDFTLYCKGKVSFQAGQWAQQVANELLAAAPESEGRKP